MKIRQLIGIAFGAILFASIPAASWASLSQGYATTSAIPTGSLVSLDEKASGTVVVADLNNAKRLFGIAVLPTGASLSLSNGDGQVQVASTGTATAFVSTENGSIKAGDYVGISQISGVGSKASGNVRVIGIAQADFTGDGQDVTKRTVDVAGVKKEVAIGQVPIEIAVSNYTNDSSQAYLVPSWLQSLSNSVAGKTVSPIRVVIAGLILLISIICITVLLYSAVRNSIISIGRNPLSRGSVFKGLLQVLLICMVILGVTVVALYLVLTR